MKKILLVILSLFSFLSSVFSQGDETKTDTAKIGLYIFSLYDLDFPGNKINADFYLWYTYKNQDSLKLIETFELVNAKNYDKMGFTDEMKVNQRYETFRCNSVLKSDWDVSNFPFDKQKVEIIVEDADREKQRLVFIPDSNGSKIDKNVKIEGWNIKDFKVKVVDNTYETTYGDPTLKPDEYTTYSRFVVSFVLEREGKGIFFKLFLGLFISVLIALVTFFIDPIDLDPRFGLSVGAIFAAIASQYVITSTLPQNQKLTLVDILHDISFVYIFLCLLFGVIALYLKKHNKEALQKKIDKRAFWSLVVSYLLLVFYFVNRALP